MTSNPLFFVLFILVIAIPLVLLTWLRQREQRRTALALQAIDAATAAHALQPEVSTDPLVIKRVVGRQTGVKWALEIRHPMAARISYPPPYLLWTAEALKTSADTVFIARSAALPPKMETSGVFSSFALHHSKTKARHPQTNGICERFHRTIQDECYAIAFRKQVYTSLEQLQADVDEWVEQYNRERTHTGKYCFGRTPLQTFRETKHLAHAKQLDTLVEQPDTVSGIPDDSPAKVVG